MQDAGPELEKFVSTKKYEPGVMLALRQMVVDIRNEVTLYGSLEGRAAGRCRRTCATRCT